MKRSLERGEVVTLDEIDCVIDGLRVKRVGTLTHRVVSERVDDIVALPDRDIFDALLWIMSRCKLVVEGAAAAPVAALLAGLVPVEQDDTVVCVLSGGNIDVEQLRGLSWN
jgi:threonine dehydratase